MIAPTVDLAAIAAVAFGGLHAMGVGFLWMFLRPRHGPVDLETAAVATYLAGSAVFCLLWGGGWAALLAVAPLPFLVGVVYGGAVRGDAVLLVRGQAVFTPPVTPLSTLWPPKSPAEPWRPTTDGWDPNDRWGPLA